MSELPLDGIGVLVTRPVELADGLCDAIEAAGGCPVRLPVVRIDPRSQGDIRTDLEALPPPDIVIFVSRNAVRHGASMLADSNAEVAAVGRATADALADMGLTVTIDPARGFTSEDLLAHESLEHVRGKNVLIVRGQDGRALLGDTLEERGAIVGYLAVYRRTSAAPSSGDIDALVEKWAGGGIQCVSVMSVATLESLVSILPDAGNELLRQTPLVGPGARVIQTAGKLVPGIPAIQASGPLPEDIVSALAAWRRSGTDQ